MVNTKYLKIVAATCLLFSVYMLFSSSSVANPLFLIVPPIYLIGMIGQYYIKGGEDKVDEEVQISGAFWAAIMVIPAVLLRYATVKVGNDMMKSLEGTWDPYIVWAIKGFFAHSFVACFFIYMMVQSYMKEFNTPKQAVQFGSFMGIIFFVLTAPLELDGEYNQGIMGLVRYFFGCMTFHLIAGCIIGHKTFTSVNIKEEFKWPGFMSMFVPWIIYSVYRTILLQIDFYTSNVMAFFFIDVVMCTIMVLMYMDIRRA
ncbi:hypothetical protein PCE1_002999 [Barthelona sp. PCE]